MTTLLEPKFDDCLVVTKRRPRREVVRSAVPVPWTPRKNPMTEYDQGQGWKLGKIIY